MDTMLGSQHISSARVTIIYFFFFSTNVEKGEELKDFLHSKHILYAHKTMDVLLPDMPLPLKVFAMIAVG